MSRTVTYKCDGCKRTKVGEYNRPPKGWHTWYRFDENKRLPDKHYCRHKCKPKEMLKQERESRKRSKEPYDSDPGVGALYGRT